MPYVSGEQSVILAEPPYQSRCISAAGLSVYSYLEHIEIKVGEWFSCLVLFRTYTCIETKIGSR